MLHSTFWIASAYTLIDSALIMKVFISWSGDLSRRVAELLKKWLPEVLQSAEPWISTEDIEKGTVWFGEISKNLDGISVGIICVTQANVNAPWILFEAGALSKGREKARVCPLLIDLKPQNLNQPLGQFNAIRPVKEDMLRLLKTINVYSPKEQLSEVRLQTAFERCWPEFEKAFTEAISNSAPATVTENEPQDMVAEILQYTRAIHSILQEKYPTEPLNPVLAKWTKKFNEAWANEVPRLAERQKAVEALMQRAAAEEALGNG
jgi:hypothetical protein